MVSETILLFVILVLHVSCVPSIFLAVVNDKEAFLVSYDVS